MLYTYIYSVLIEKQKKTFTTSRSLSLLWSPKDTRVTHFECSFTYWKSTVFLFKNKIKWFFLFLLRLFIPMFILLICGVCEHLDCFLRNCLSLFYIVLWDFIDELIMAIHKRINSCRYCFYFSSHVSWWLKKVKYIEIKLVCFIKIRVH